MRRSFSGLIVGLAFLATACAPAAGAPPPARPAAGPAGAAPAADQDQARGWQRPSDVAPLPPQGRFEVISKNPWPGDKVRVFFLGAQG
jgi:hypothetical protein